MQRRVSIFEDCRLKRAGTSHAQRELEGEWENVVSSSGSSVQSHGLIRRLLEQLLSLLSLAFALSLGRLASINQGRKIL